MNRPKSRVHRARLYESVRTAHLERAHQLAPALIIYRERRYDFDTQLAEGLTMVQANPVKAAILLARLGPETVEINEPLMLSSLPGSLLALIGLRIGSLFTGRESTIVSYAIGNENPFRQMSTNKLRTRLRRKMESVLARLLMHGIDRLAFGTEAAQSLYHDLLPVRTHSMAEKLIPALPAPCTCDASMKPEENRVIYLGDLSHRKGFPALADAWPVLLAHHPNARLTILGKGALEELAHSMEVQHPSVEVQIDPERAEIHRQLRRAKVLVLPSQVTATWREQVGLPIVEGLAHGCRIVTTTQTGLSTWLSDHGHSTLEPEIDSEVLAETLRSQLGSPLDKDKVCAVLPDQDGRLAADAWLFDYFQPAS